MLPFYHKNQPEAACEKLVKEATLAWKREDEVIDDITCIVIFLKINSPVSTNNNNITNINNM